MNRRLDLLDALIYADGFDCALTLEEVRRYARVKIGLEQLRGELTSDGGLACAVAQRSGLYALADRPELIEQRPRRIARARVLQRHGRRMARLLRHLPFVRGLAMTGSVAVDDAREDADVDLLVIVARGRLATVFLLFAPAARLLRGRAFCPNYYVVEGELAMAPDDPYLARELVQARCLAGSAIALRDANPWLATMFPNADAEDAGLPLGGKLQRTLEMPLRGRLGDRLEQVAVHIAARRLRVHYAAAGVALPEDVVDMLDAGTSLRFHALHDGESMVARYTARRDQVSRMLEGQATELAR